LRVGPGPLFEIGAKRGPQGVDGAFVFLLSRSTTAIAFSWFDMASYINVPRRFPGRGWRRGMDEADFVGHKGRNNRPAE
jgi:hypothetical protein